MNKKGSIQDLVMIAIILGVFSFLILLGYRIYSEINTEFQSSSIINDQGKQASTTINNMFPGALDNSFLILTVGLGIVAISLAALVRVHPVFLVFFILMLAIIIFFCGIFSNIYEELANADATMEALASDLTFSTHVMHYLPFIVGIFGGILAIVMYKAYREAQYGM